MPNGARRGLDTMKCWLFHLQQKWFFHFYFLWLATSDRILARMTRNRWPKCAVSIIPVQHNSCGWHNYCKLPSIIPGFGWRRSRRQIAAHTTVRSHQRQWDCQEGWVTRRPNGKRKQAKFARVGPTELGALKAERWKPHGRCQQSKSKIFGY